MSEDSSNPKSEDTGKEPSGGLCGSRSCTSLPVILSGIAVLLAVAALAVTLLGQQRPREDLMQAMNMKLGQVEARITGLESQLASNRVDVAHTELNRILLELENLSALVDATTRSKVDQAYQLLKPLSPTAMEKGAPSTQTPESSASQSPGENPAATQPEPSAQTQPSEPAAGQSPETTAPQSSPAAESGADQSAPAATDESGKAAQPATDNTSGTTQDSAPASNAAAPAR
jgi:uncharacterized coiled-coil protein SlyX